MLQIICALAFDSTVLFNVIHFLFYVFLVMLFLAVAVEKKKKKKKAEAKLSVISGAGNKNAAFTQNTWMFTFYHERLGGLCAKLG